MAEVKKIEFKEFEQLKKFQPIPHGRVKYVLLLLWHVIFALGISCILATFAYFFFQIVLFKDINQEAGYALVIVIACFMIPFVYITLFKTSNFYRDYLKRNFNGYTLWIIENDNKASYWFYEADAERPKEAIVGLALGGIDNRNRLIIDPSGNWMISGFKIEFTNFNSNFLTNSNFHLHITFTDTSGNRIGVDELKALWMAKEIKKDGLTTGCGSIIYHLMDLSKEKENTQQELSKYELEINDLESENDRLINFLYAILKRIKETKRFRYSEEGREIRLDGTKGLLLFLPDPDDPMRVELEQDLKDEEQKQDKKKSKTA